MKNLNLDDNMNTYGKKQVDIREDNKSAVIDILLQGNFTIFQMSKKLKLSHTALAKVIKELDKKNILTTTETQSITSGRPPKSYGVNADCAIACAIILTMERIMVYYVDMRGFQINENVCKNDFANMNDLLVFISQKLVDLKLHPRLEDKILKYIYIGIPTANFYGMTFSETEKKIYEVMSKDYKGINVVLNRNIDCEMVAEKKYGLFKDEIQNAILVNFDRYFCFSLLIKGEVYHGDEKMQGYSQDLKFEGIEGIFGNKYLEIAEKYNVNDESAKMMIEEHFLEPLKILKIMTKYLDIKKVAFSGKITKFGENFLQYANGLITGCDLCYSAMDSEGSLALSGAVWMSTYNTLQDVMLR